MYRHRIGFDVLSSFDVNQIDRCTSQIGCDVLSSFDVNQIDRCTSQNRL